MSKLRPDLADATNEPCMKNGTAYFMILQAVEAQSGLLHGKLHAYGEHCAIGSYFYTNAKTALPNALIDEVAAVNDSMPKATPRQRRLLMLRWLRWKLSVIGVPGYTRAKRPQLAQRDDASDS